MSQKSLQSLFDDLHRQLADLRSIAARDPGQLAVIRAQLLEELRPMNDLLSIAGPAPGTEGPELGGRTAPSAPADPAEDVARIRIMADLTASMIWISEADRSSRWVNRAWLDYTGRSPAQEMGRGWLEGVHPEDRERCIRLLAEGEPASLAVHFEYRLRGHDDHYRWILELGTPRFSSRGNLLGYIGTATDVTEQSEAARRLALQVTVAKVLWQAEKLEDAAAPILQALCQSGSWKVGQLWKVEPPGRTLRCAYSWSCPTAGAGAFVDASRRRTFAPGTGLPGRVWQSGEAAWIEDVVVDDNFPRASFAEGTGLHAACAVPVALQGQTLAVFELLADEIRPRDDATLADLAAVGRQLSQFLDRKQAEERIRQSETHKTAVFEAALDAVITIDHHGRIVEVNSAAERTFGWPRAELLGVRLGDLLVPIRLREAHFRGITRYLETGEGAALGKRLEMPALRRDGTEFPVELTILRIPGEGPPMFTGFVRDITDRALAAKELAAGQDRLRALASDLLLAEERERRRLAVDLHDGLSQTLALVRMKLPALRESSSGSPARALSEIEKLVEEADRSARSLTFQLSPPVLHELGLEPALQWLAEDVRNRYVIEVAFEDDGQEKPTDERVRVILFRSVRELLINAAKHSGASRVLVRLRRQGDEICAEVADNGVGLGWEAVGTRGHGLLSVRERMTHIGGSMRILSEPGRGATIRLCAPLEKGA